MSTLGVRCIYANRSASTPSIAWVSQSISAVVLAVFNSRSPMKKLHLEIDRRHAGYITPSLTRTLEQAAQCGAQEHTLEVL